jgi:hypothetical protein
VAVKRQLEALQQRDERQTEEGMQVHSRVQVCV